jgi:hypothetical protein
MSEVEFQKPDYDHIKQLEEDIAKLDIEIARMDRDTENSTPETHIEISTDSGYNSWDTHKVDLSGEYAGIVEFGPSHTHDIKTYDIRSVIQENMQIQADAMQRQMNAALSKYERYEFERQERLRRMENPLTFYSNGVKETVTVRLIDAKRRGYINRESYMDACQRYGAHTNDVVVIHPEDKRTVSYGFDVRTK